MTTTIELVKIEVGGLKIKCYKNTLTDGSGYFKSRYAAEWAGRELADEAANGGYRFIDRDGDLFKHILAFLRSGEPPIFYDNIKGHDLVMYQRVYAEACFFGVEKLVDWLKKKKYEGYITVNTSIRVQDCADSSILHSDQQEPTSVDIKVMSMTDNVYFCPRGKEAHRNQPSRCGRDCTKKWGQHGPVFTLAKVLKIVEIRKEVKINPVSVYETSEAGNATVDDASEDHVL